jgi:hypothetical protein
MGNENATLLFVVSNTNWVNATFLMGDLEEVNLSVDREAVYPPKPGTRVVCGLSDRRRG